MELDRRGCVVDHLGGAKWLVLLACPEWGALAVLAILALLASAGFWWKRNEALLETKIALGGKLAAESNALRLQRSELLPQSLLKSIESMHQFQSLEADQAIRNGLTLLPSQFNALQREGSVAALVVQPGGNLVATVGSNGNVAVSNRCRFEERALNRTLWVRSLAQLPLAWTNSPVVIIGRVTKDGDQFALAAGFDPQHAEPVRFVVTTPARASIGVLAFNA